MTTDPELYKFTVTGTGSFPEDMLRYDACWPMHGNLSEEWADKRNEPREIVMLSHRWNNTPERWQSFLWAATVPCTVGGPALMPQLEHDGPHADGEVVRGCPACDATGNPPALPERDERQATNRNFGNALRLQWADYGER
jgi:hypothetical protein